MLTEVQQQGPKTCGRRPMSLVLRNRVHEDIGRRLRASPWHLDPIENMVPIKAWLRQQGLTTRWGQEADPLCGLLAGHALGNTTI